ncbi:MAG: serine/threonine protein kinase [Planctomycetes bacterium]|nr:serine/threonine protein kinase [Planctomycetota bacterium]
MYCPHCGIQFSGTQGSGLCPYCQRPAEPSGSAPRPEATETLPASSGAPGGAAGVADAAAKPDGDRTRTETPGEWAAGSLVAGKYEVVSRLGAGGFGTVHKVRHIYRKKYYALKTPHAEFARDPTFRVRFEREIEAMERFVHPDAVMIRDSGVTESGTPYYTMDYIDGENLKAILRREKRLPVDRALPIIRRILRVLEVAHNHQIIHRDIKPDNILITRQAGRETVKVLDFGVAKLLDLVGETGSVTHGMRVGTPKYMSPEQITGGEVDARSDIFSLGIVFYEMLLGEHPFAKVNDPIRVTAAILNTQPPEPREQDESIPKTISDYVLWMLEKKPRRRPESARVLIKHLGPVEEGVSQVEPLESLSVCTAVPRGPAAAVVLRQETSVGERRSFISFSERIRFGRTNDPERGIQNDFIWRCLPCRSQAKDPENWQRNLTISQQLGTVYPEGTTVVVEPALRAKHGIGIGGVRSFRPARMHADRFHISLGDKALELDGFRMLRSSDPPDLDLSFLGLSRPAGVQAPQASGFSNASCLIDHISFQRASNWPLHEYFIVLRLLKIGSSANAGLRLRSPGVESEHAAVIFDEGEAFILPLGGKIIVRGDIDVFAAAPSQRITDPHGIELEPSCLLPLRPGLELVLGDAHLRVDAAADSLFKTV